MKPETKEKIDKAHKLIQEGMSMRKAMKEVGVSYESYMKYSGLRHYQHLRPGVVKRLEKMQQFLDQGMSLSKAARQAGVSPSTYRIHKSLLDRKESSSLPTIPKPTKPSPTIVNLELHGSGKVLVVAGDCDKVEKILAQLGKVMQ